ncbi:galactosylgalactosylxylosylprotein 3-beta-glucuronosyltransferase S-like [Scylla paramamosain]|uniref:galactosylgalactosylxylosylprotein 3-beta-glucuronosyltransferase S-like n=1 Tax=Scylla paramamosain TaxID=85552 RepID=UPI00308295FA
MNTCDYAFAHTCLSCLAIRRPARCKWTAALDHRSVMHCRAWHEVMRVMVVVEALLLVAGMHWLVSCRARCAPGRGGMMEEEPMDSSWPPVYLVTPTYRRTAQMADLTRLAQTLMLVPGLHWVVVEDAEVRSEAVAELLDRTGLRYTHLAATKPPNFKKKFLGRGVFNRREGLRWLRQHATEGVLYFADDDNTYDVRIFHEIRRTQRVSVFPVGMILQLGISSPVVRNGKVVKFHDGFQAGRKFALDMAGFAVNLRVLHANPQATMPERLTFLEDGFLKQLHLELEDLEPLASGCTEVLVWHTRTQSSPTPLLENLSKEDMDTNLITLYRNMLR